MKIIIKDKEFSKVDLLNLIKSNKIQAIMHVRAIVNLGLKESKEIVENLEVNPAFYDNNILIEEDKDFVVEKNKVRDFKKVDTYLIDDISFSKYELLELINKSKLGAVKYLKNSLNISLKESNEIIENLASNKDFYKNDIINLNSSKLKKTVTKKRKGKIGSHFIKEDNKIKRYIMLLGFILILFLFIFLSYK